MAEQKKSDKNKQEGYDETAPEGNSEEEMVAERRLDMLEDDMKCVKNDVGTMKGLLEKAVKKMEDDDEDHEKKKEEEEDKPEDEEKKKEEDKPEDESEKKKEVAATDVGQPGPEGGETELPKSVGETDETAKPETDVPKVDFVEKKDMAKAVKKFIEENPDEVLKSLGIEKTSTPRPKHENTEDVQKGKMNNEVALDMIKQVREGKMTLADMNMKIKDMQKNIHDQKVEEIMKTVKAPEVE